MLNSEALEATEQIAWGNLMACSRYKGLLLSVHGYVT